MKERKQVVFNVDNEIHKAAKSYAALNDMKLYEVLEMALVRFLDLKNDE